MGAFAGAAQVISDRQHEQHLLDFQSNYLQNRALAEQFSKLAEAPGTPEEYRDVLRQHAMDATMTPPMKLYNKVKLPDIVKEVEQAKVRQNQADPTNWTPVDPLALKHGIPASTGQGQAPQGIQPPPSGGQGFDQMSGQTPTAATAMPGGGAGIQAPPDPTQAVNGAISTQQAAATAPTPVSGQASPGNGNPMSVGATAGANPETNPMLNGPMGFNPQESIFEEAHRLVGDPPPKLMPGHIGYNPDYVRWVSAYQNAVDTGSKRREMLTEAHAVLGPNPHPEDLANYINKHPLSTGSDLKEGELRLDRFGKVIAAGPPKPVTTAEGATTNLVPTAPSPLPGLSSIAAGPPKISGATTLATSPPKLTPDESKLVSAVARIAAKNNVPFDPTKNPRNPLAQLPLPMQGDAIALADAEKMDPVMRASLLGLRATSEALRQAETQNALNQRADRSYQNTKADLDNLSKPVLETATRIGRLQDALDQHTPQADALVAPMLLTVEAGGLGSGLRMTEAEMAREVGGRSVWENLKAKIQHWSTNPDAARSITPDQDRQIRQLLTLVTSKVAQKQALLTDAFHTISTSDDVGTHRKTLADVRDKLASIDMPAKEGLKPPPGQEVPANVHRALSSVGPGRHTLSDGSVWHKTADGKVTKE